MMLNRQRIGVLLNTDHLENALVFASNGYDPTANRYLYSNRPRRKLYTSTCRTAACQDFERTLGQRWQMLSRAMLKDTLRKPPETSRGRMQRDPPPVSTHNPKGGKVECVQSRSRTNGCADFSEGLQEAKLFPWKDRPLADAI